MKTSAASGRRTIFAGLIAAAVPGAAFAVVAGPEATGANDPCAASEVAGPSVRSPSRWATTWTRIPRPTRR